MISLSLITLGLTNCSPAKVAEQEQAIRRNSLTGLEGEDGPILVVKIDDNKKRKKLELDGYDVLVWDYTSEQVDSFVSRRQDIFRKVR
jgi:hypothetical protein